MKAKIYITDEGFGPLVRQSAIVEELLRLNSGLQITLQTSRHIDAAQRIFKGIGFIDKFNNISWDKTPEGSPDIERIRKAYANYKIISEDFIYHEQAEFNYSFAISDFVYEAFEIGKNARVPVFGVSHFLWDWFFSKLYPAPLNDGLLKRFISQAKLARVLYFPPFTPSEIINNYKGIVKEVPLIVRKTKANIQAPSGNRFNILIMDSGSEVLHRQLLNGLESLRSLTDFHFFISSSFDISGDNFTVIDKNALFVDYIPFMDLVISRAGFNTISECIAYRTPMLLIVEAMNPEMNENIIQMKDCGLGSFVSIDKFVKSVHSFLPRFVDHEYPFIRQHMDEHEYQTDGARVIAEDILNSL